MPTASPPGKTTLTQGSADDTSDDFPLNLKEAEEILIGLALKKTDGNIAAASRILGTNRPRIYKHIEDRE